MFDPDQPRKSILAIVLMTMGLVLVGGAAIYYVALKYGDQMMASIFGEIPTPGEVSAPDGDAAATAPEPAAEPEPAPVSTAVFVPDRLIQFPSSFRRSGYREGPLTLDRMGYVFGSDFAVTADNTPAPVAAIMTGTVSATLSTPIEKVEPLEQKTECTLRKPASGEKLVNVNIGFTGKELGFDLVSHATNIGILERAVGDFMAKAEEAPQLGPFELSVGSFGAIDVYITDTSAPLYLALQSGDPSVIWNIHAAPGVTIAHVALIASGRAGLAGNIGSARVEVLAAPTFRVPADFFDFGNRFDPTDYECMVRPFRMPNDTWEAWDGAKEGNDLDANLLLGQTNGYKAFEYWYEGALGRNPQENIIQAAIADSVLIGPLPDAPIAMTESAALTVHVPMFDEAVITGTKEERVAILVETYREILTTAAGGDLSAIFPPELTLGAGKPGGETNLREDQDDSFVRATGINNFELGDLRPLVDMTSTNTSRRVSFDVTARLSEVLAEGEEPPPENLRRLYMLLRAPKYIERYCADTLDVIAARCRVVQASIREESKEKGFRIDATFAYLPNYDFGEIKRDGDNGVMTAFLPSPNPNSKFETPASRKAFLEKLVKACDEIRKERGNCVISTVRFDIADPARYSGSGTVAGAAGWVSVFGLKTSFEESLFQERAEEIWKTIN